MVTLVALAFYGRHLETIRSRHELLTRLQTRPLIAIASLSGRSQAAALDTRLSPSVASQRVIG